MFVKRPSRMILWKLKAFMDKYRITNRELSSRLGKHENSISRLKNKATMPKIDGGELNNICSALEECLQELGVPKPVEIEDLVEFISDNRDPSSDVVEEQQSPKIVEFSSPSPEKREKKKGYESAA